MKKTYLAAFLSLLLPTFAFAGQYIQPSNKSVSCKIYNDYPQPKETATWSGGCNQHGYAFGKGTIHWHINNKLIQSITGELVAGKLVEHYTMYDPYTGKTTRHYREYRQPTTEAYSRQPENTGTETVQKSSSDDLATGLATMALLVGAAKWLFSDNDKSKNEPKYYCKDLYVGQYLDGYLVLGIGDGLYTVREEYTPEKSVFQTRCKR